jgi:hypothetical protein
MINQVQYGSGDVLPECMVYTCLKVVRKESIATLHPESRSKKVSQYRLPINNIVEDIFHTDLFETTAFFDTARMRTQKVGESP